jgi:hypothetical protein
VVNTGNLWNKQSDLSPRNQHGEWPQCQVGLLYPGTIWNNIVWSHDTTVFSILVVHTHFRKREFLILLLVIFTALKN